MTAPAALERTVERATARAIEGTGFRPQGHRLDVVGLCRTCA